jgi:hypothetical protein
MTLPACRLCDRALEPHDRAGVHWTCAREAANRAADYGPEVRVGVRVMHRRTEETGRVVRIDDGCHWGGLNPYDERWRPRAACVLRDGDRPSRDDVIPPLRYWEPEHVAVIPEHWRGGAGIFGAAPDRPANRTRPLCATVVRPLPTAQGREWHLMHRPDRGFAERSYGYRTWSDLLDAWAVVIGEPGQDEHGVFVRVTPEGQLP